MIKVKEERTAVQIRNKAIAKRNKKKAATLVFCGGTVLTTFGSFMNIISQGNPPVGMETQLTVKLLSIAIIGCVAFGSAVLVATKRSN